ncbi:MAG: flagellar hook-basal body complex protein FliE [Solirubrobacteraceae bacterium]
MIPAISGAIGPLGGSEWNIGSLTGSGPTNAGGAGTTGAPGTFGGALANALNSLETSQANATTAAQQLATGQSADPTQAITAVENASLSMDYAAQIRNQITTAANTIFQTQV